MTGWVTALRIARREAQRKKGISALITAMIFLPIMALGFAAATFDMFRLTPVETFTQRYGAADAALTWRHASPVQQDARGEQVLGDGGEQLGEEPAAERVRAVLGTGRVLRYDEGRMTLRTAAGVGDFRAVAVDAADPATRGLVAVVDGGAPRAAGDIAVTRPAAERLGVGVGDTVQAAHGGAAWTVAGIVEFPADLGERVLFGPGGMPAGDRAESTWLAATGAPVTWDDVQRLNRSGIVVASRAVWADPLAHAPTAYDGGARGAVNVGLLVGVFGLLEIVLLAGPAFAVGARRRQRDLALVAVNGGTPAHLRRIVLADGVVLGAAAAVLGVAVAVGLAFALRPFVEEYLVGSRAGGYRVFPAALGGIAALAVGTGVLAALIPAVTAARFDLVSALTGRRATVRSRRRWWALGALVAAGGAALGAHGARTVAPSTILMGLVLVVFGLVLCTPALVGLIGSTARFLPLALRIALRDTSRNRSSAAPAIAAVMAAVSVSVVASVYLTSSQLQDDMSYQPGLPIGSAYIDYAEYAPPLAADPRRPSNEVTAVARASLDVRGMTELRGFDCTAQSDAYCALTPVLPAGTRCFMLDLPRPYTVAQQRSARADRRCDGDSGRWRPGTSFGVAVGDGALVAAATNASQADVAAATRVLARGGVVVRDARLVRDGKVTLTVRDERRPGNGQDVPDERLPHVTVLGHVLTSGTGSPDQMFLSPGVVTRAGFAVVPLGLLVATSAVPTQAQEDRLRGLLLGISPEASQFAIVERGPAGRSDPIVLLLAAVAGLITLGAAGIATGLAAADGRADLSILATVGASPAVSRLLSVSQSGLIAGLGSMLGVSTGLAAIFAMLTAYNRAASDRWPIEHAFPLTMPWHTVAVAVGVPLVAMLGAGLLTRSATATARPLT